MRTFDHLRIEILMDTRGGLFCVNKCMVKVVNKNTHVEVELRVFMVAFQQNQGNIQHVNPVVSVMAFSINFLTVFPHKILHFLCY